MRERRIGSRTYVILLGLFMALVAATLVAQPPEPVTAILISGLSADDVWSLPEEQLIITEDTLMTVAELAAIYEERIAAMQEPVATDPEAAREALEGARAAAAARRQALLESEMNWIEALHTRLRSEEERCVEAVRQARELGAERRQVYQMLLPRAQAAGRTRGGD